MGTASDLLVWIIFFCGLGAWAELRRMHDRLRALESRVDSVREHLGITPKTTVPPEVEGLIKAGRKIEAIKAYRRATGAGLVEAKDHVERIEARVTGSPIIVPGGRPSST